MADDRMKDDDAQRNMGGAGNRGEGQNMGQQSPGRTGQSGQQSGQHAGGQQGGQFGGQKDQRNMEDDDLATGGGAGKSGGQNRGGQNR